MDLSTLLYIEVNAICLLILSFLLHKNRQNMDKSTENRAFNWVLTATVIIFALEIAWALIENNTFGKRPFLNALVNATYLFESGVIGYTWVYFTECKFEKSVFRKKKVFLIMGIPLLFLGIVSYASIWTKWLFYIDANNVYHRGAWHLIQPIIGYMYLLFAALRTLYWLKRERNVEIRLQYMTLLSFTYLPAIAGIIGIFVYEFPTIWIFGTLSLLMVFVNFQEHQISTDGLTGVNNRRQLDKYLAGQKENSNKSQKLYLFIIDINSFKKINDTYGHQEGDHALVTVAGVLKTVSKKYNAFLARYGGDEFALACWFTTEEEAFLVKEEIGARMEALGKLGQLKYNITVSVGYAVYEVNAKEMVPKLIAAADEELYREKRKFHKEK